MTDTESAGNLNSLNRRVTELETMLMHLQRDLESMSEVMQAQHRQIESLQRELKTLKEKRDSDGFELPDPLDEKPPHY